MIKTHNPWLTKISKDIEQSLTVAQAAWTKLHSIP